MIVDCALDVQVNDLFVRLKYFAPGLDLFLKMENLNLAGTIKLKPAIHMIGVLEREGVIQPGRNRVVESSSGNLGLALSIVCAVKGYPFLCVADPNSSVLTQRLIKAYGGSVIVVDERDENGGYLGSRIRFIRELIQQDPSSVWPNQYCNPANPESHYLSTAPEVHRAFPSLDYLVVGAGTTGTLVGCARYFSLQSPRTRVIAVDSVGSVTFGHRASPRFIPGLGTSCRPEIASENNVTDLIMVPEAEAISVCWEVRRTYGMLVGGSTGSVLAGIRHLAAAIAPGSSVVALSADAGDRYVDTVYNPDWIRKNFGTALAQAVQHPDGLGSRGFATTVAPALAQEER